MKPRLNTVRSHCLYYTVFFLLLSALATAEIDVYQNSLYINASTSMDPGPKGLGGLLTSINNTVPTASIQVSGTWFEDTDRIIIDALFIVGTTLVNNGNCTLHLKDSGFEQIITSAPMQLNNISGQPHYTFNATNISAIAGNASSGKFFGHVQCIRTSPTVNVFSVADFEVHPVTNTILAEIRATKTSLQALLQRQFDFSQEEVFLITDSFTTMTEILDAVEGGRMSGAEANAQVKGITARLEETLGDKYRSAAVSIKPKASLSSFISEVASTPRKLAGSQSFTKILVFLVVIYGVYLIYHGKHEDEF